MKESNRKDDPERFLAQPTRVRGEDNAKWTAFAHPRGCLTNERDGTAFGLFANTVEGERRRVGLGLSFERLLRSIYLHMLEWEILAQNRGHPGKHAVTWTAIIKDGCSGSYYQMWMPLEDARVNPASYPGDVPRGIHASRNRGDNNSLPHARSQG